MPTYNITSGLPSTPVGLKDADASLVSPLYLAANSLAQQISVLTGNVEYNQADLAAIDQLVSVSNTSSNKLYVKADVTLPYGALVSLTINGGRLGAKLADATILTAQAHAICNMPSGIPAGSYGIVLLMTGRCAGVSGTVLGSTYYLSTAGTMQLSSPTADGVLNQIVAIGLGSAGIYLNIEQVGKRVCRTYKTSAINLRTQYTDGTFTDAAV